MEAESATLRSCLKAQLALLDEPDFPTSDSACGVLSLSLVFRHKADRETEATKKLLGEPIDDISPTLGFQIRTINVDGYATSFMSPEPQEANTGWVFLQTVIFQIVIVLL